MRRCLLLAGLLLLWLPAAASAGTASVGLLPSSFPGNMQFGLVYAAAPGERNQIVVDRAIGTGFSLDYVLADSAGVVAGPGCRSTDARTVRCAATNGLTTLAIDAGDGDDSVTVPPSSSGSTSVLGGDGADVLSGAGALSGGPGNDLLTGGQDTPCDKACGPPRDVLAGGSGDDILRGGAGDDLLVGDGDGPQSLDPGGGNDVIDGGEGRDEVSYAGRSESVRIDLDEPDAGGASGERDSFTGIESVTGGDVADVLLGGDGDDGLHGGGGEDRIDGRGGDDQLTGGPGADTLRGGGGDDQLHGAERTDALFGGAGDDHILGGFGSADRPGRTLSCGSGRDRVDNPRGQVLDSCEQVEVNDVTVSAPQRLPGGRVRFEVGCHAGMRCEMTLALRGVARRSVSVRFGARRGVVLRPRRRVRRGTAIEVAVSGRTVVGDATIGPSIGSLPFTGRWRVRL